MTSRILAPTKAKQCHARGCGHFALARLVVVLVFAEGKQYKFRTKMQICADHQRTLRLDDVFSAEGWLRLAESWTKNGNAAPVRELSRLEFEEAPPIPERQVRPS